MSTTDTYNVCDCRFTVKALSEFLLTFGRAPMSNKDEDCLWVGKRIDAARAFNTNERFQNESGKFAIVNYWKCRRMGKIVPLSNGKVGLNPL